jgi:hypothetical protein
MGWPGFAAAVTAAVHHATGIQVRELPIKIEIYCLGRSRSTVLRDRASTCRRLSSARSTADCKDAERGVILGCISCFAPIFKGGHLQRGAGARPCHMLSAISRHHSRPANRAPATGKITYRACINNRAVAAKRCQRHSWRHANAAVCGDHTRPVFGCANAKGARAPGCPTGQSRTEQFGRADPLFAAERLGRSAATLGRY